MPAFDGKENCPLCHGSGTLYDWVPYGMGNVQMPTGCDCVAEQMDAWQEAQDAMRDEFDVLEQQAEDLTTEQTARYAELYAKLYGHVFER